MLRANTFTIISCALVLASLFAQGETADTVLGRMDREAASFSDMTAKVIRTTYTAVLNESDEESGSIRMKRAGPRKALMRVEITSPDVRSVGIEGTTAQIYYPKINTVQIWDLGKEAAFLEQFALLGFGTPRKEMEKNYSIRLVGAETVNGRPTTRLELTPRSPKVLEQVKALDLWIPNDSGHPVKQRFLLPGGDYYLITYSDVKLNANLPDAAIRLDLPKNAKREYPQK